MKSFFRLLLGMLCVTTNLAWSQATDLLQIYQDALRNDPAYLKAVAQRLGDREDIAIRRAALLPQLLFTGGPFLSTQRVSSPPSTTNSHSYLFMLYANQDIVNFSSYFSLSKAKKTACEADAKFNIAFQDLIQRVTKAYFNILKDEDKLRYARANKNALQKQFERVKLQRLRGLTTKTNLYLAESSYASSEATYLTAQTNLIHDQEKLRAITGNDYEELAKLKYDVPLIKPHPTNIETWVDTAKAKNWSIQAALYASQAALENIKQQNAAHLPTLSLRGAYITGYNKSVSNTNNNTNNNLTVAPFNNLVIFTLPNAHFNDTTVSLIVNLPLSTGGYISARARQARHYHQARTQNLVETIRTTITTTKQSYLGVLSAIQQINAEKKALSAATFSLKGLKAGYQSGTQTLIDVLNQQREVLNTQMNYANARYLYINHLISLKRAAGTLGPNDIQIINSWLTNNFVLH